MIGVIGPADSVRLGAATAAEDGLDQSVITRAYAHADQAPELARELDRVCHVLLFTGRFPFAISSRHGGLRSALQYIPHSGADLYAAIVRLLRERRCELPRVSVDTIEPGLLEEAFVDLGMDAPTDVLALDVDMDDDGVRTSADLVAFHRDRHRSGSVELGLTCVGSVAETLDADGIPVMRITHTKSVMREALRQAHLTERLAMTEATQPAAVLIELPTSSSDGADDLGPYEGQRRRLRAREIVLDIAERLQGRLADIDDATSMVYTSRGTIEAALTRLRDGHDGPLRLDQRPPELRLGIGLGRTVAAAEESARLALAMGERDGDLHVGFPDGDVLRISEGQPATTYHLRDTHPATLEVARELGIGPLAMTRLTRALRQVDASAVTAAELARAYGIETRSARRIITSLQRTGIATRLGQQGGAGAGRPQSVYRIDVERLAGSRGA